MILKKKDPIDGQLRMMERALSGPLPTYERLRIEKELAWQKAGLYGEKEAAYHIDFHLKNSPNWAVIHDLRLESNGRVAQVDHLLVDRFMQIYVVETKSFRTKMRHANSGWERLNANEWEGIPSPVEQNERHILVLKDLVKDQRLVPTRLGLGLEPLFLNIVVVQPSCSIMGTIPDDVRIYRIDQFVRKIRAENPPPLNLLKVISEETLRNFATELVANHLPAAKVAKPPNNFRLTPAAMLPVGPSPASCQSCRGSLSAAEASYCRGRKSRFGGHLLCRKCQSFVPQES